MSLVIAIPSFPSLAQDIRDLSVHSAEAYINRTVLLTYSQQARKLVDL